MSRDAIIGAVRLVVGLALAIVVLLPIVILLEVALLISSVFVGREDVGPTERDETVNFSRG